MGGGADDSSEDAAKVQAQSQREALAYLKQTEKLPQAYREGSFNQLGSEYGFTMGPDGTPVSDGSSISERAMSSPFYTQAVRLGEESVLRNASATGGLRSGNANEALANVNQQAYLASYQNQLSGLQGFAQLPSNANNIAAQQSSIGQTQAAGIIGGANSAAAQQQANYNNAGALANTALSAWDTFSDARLKSDVVFVGVVNGHNTYTWVWNELAQDLGLSGPDWGVIADEVERTHPEAVSIRSGYKVVNYPMIGVEHHGLHV